MPFPSIPFFWHCYHNKHKHHEDACYRSYFSYYPSLFLPMHILTLPPEYYVKTSIFLFHFSYVHYIPCTLIFYHKKVFFTMERNVLHDVKIYYFHKTKLKRLIVPRLYHFFQQKKYHKPLFCNTFKSADNRS